MVRQDYLLRLIEQLGRIVGELLRFRRDGRHTEALLAIVQAQEKLFARPATEIAPLTLEAQVALLVLDEAPPAAVRKCFVHARLLAEAALTYDAIPHGEARDGARAAASEVLRLAREKFPTAYAEACAGDMAEQLAAIRAAGVVESAGTSERV